MTNRRQIVLIVLISLSSITVSGGSHEGSVEAIAGQSSNVPRPQQAPKTALIVWEYKILYGTKLQLASLESEINNYARDGFVVDSFQAVASITGGNAYNGPVRLSSDGTRTYDNLFRINSESEVIILLKRLKP